MKKVIIFIISVIGIISLIAPVSAQQDSSAPDYRISVGSNASQVSTDGSQIIVQASVVNNGGDSTQETTVELVNLANGEVITSEPIIALDAGQSQSVTLEFPVTTFPANSEHAMWVQVDIDEIESTIFDNRVSISVVIPNYSVTSTDTNQSSQTSEEPTTSGNTENIETSIITIPIIDKEIDLANRNDVLLMAGILACSVIIFWLFFNIMRMLFRRYPKFGNWQPPYATVPPMDPNSTVGRRQMWQPHAQNNNVLNPCVEGQIYPRKLLLGTDGFHLSGWKIKALRMTQYDTYGRVSRSETLATSGDIGRLNRVAKRSMNWDEQKIHKQVRGIAKRISKRMNKRIQKRGAQLPIALDVRVQGKHGEVRIIFELYQCQYGHPQQLDNWEPEMVVGGQTMYESYTYTVNGQSGNETTKMFRKRLPSDVEAVLANMFNTSMPQVTPTPQIVNTPLSPSTAPSMPPAPDPLSSTQPIATQTNTTDTAEHGKG